eukprot:jgi/Mesvir1/5730/Mv03797-RA.1
MQDRGVTPVWDFIKTLGGWETENYYRGGGEARFCYSPYAGKVLRLLRDNFTEGRDYKIDERIAKEWEVLKASSFEVENWHSSGSRQDKVKKKAEEIYRICTRSRMTTECCFKMVAHLVTDIESFGVIKIHTVHKLGEVMEALIARIEALEARERAPRPITPPLIDLSSILE